MKCISKQIHEPHLPPKWLQQLNDIEKLMSVKPQKYKKILKLVRQLKKITLEHINIKKKVEQLKKENLQRKLKPYKKNTKKWCVCGAKNGIYWMAHGKIIRENSTTIELQDEVSGEPEIWTKNKSKIVRFETKLEAQKLYKKEFQYAQNF